jgi:HEAT repeat protein
MLRSSWAAALLVAIFSSTAFAQVSREAMERALSGYENPISARRLEALGQGWEKTLELLVADASTRPLLRVRAISALRFSKSVSAAAALRQVLKEKGSAVEGAPVAETREALRSLAQVAGVQAASEIERFLDHAVPDVRAAAAQSLAATGWKEASRLLKARLEREREPFVRVAIERQLTAL